MLGALNTKQIRKVPAQGTAAPRELGWGRGADGQPHKGTVKAQTFYIPREAAELRGRGAGGGACSERKYQARSVGKEGAPVQGTRSPLCDLQQVPPSLGPRLRGTEPGLGGAGGLGSG